MTKVTTEDSVSGERDLLHRQDASTAGSVVSERCQCAIDVSDARGADSCIDIREIDSRGVHARAPYSIYDGRIDIPNLI